MPKNKSKTNVADGIGVSDGADQPIIRERTPRRDGRPHPPEGHRYNKAGEIVPSIPPEMRGYYLVVGLSRANGMPEQVSRFKSSLSALRYCEGSKRLLLSAYSAVEVVKCKRFATVFGA